MKKIVSLALVAALAVGFCGPVAHAEDLNSPNTNTFQAEKLNTFSTKPIQVQCSYIFNAIGIQPQVSSYANNSDKGVDQILKLDKQIEQKIDQATNQAQRLVDKFQAEVNNLQRDNNGQIIDTNMYNQLAQKLDSDINEIINNLVKDTNKLVKKMQYIAEANGIEIVSEYVLVQIGDQSILIDPCRVLGE